MRVFDYRNKIERLRGQERTLLKMKAETQQNVVEYEQALIDIEEAQKIVQEVALATQGKIRMAIEPIVTSALDIVFRDEAYGFAVDFDIKRNKTECTFSFTRDGNKYTPMENSGFGAIDIAAFALRLALWNISKPKSRPVFVLDEPFKHLSADLQEKAFEMVQELTKRLDIQVILVSHSTESDVFEYSDRVIKVWKDKNSISHAKIVRRD